VDYFQVGHWSLVAVTTGASTDEPLAVAEVRGHFRLESDTDDFTVAGKLLAARKRIETRTLRSLMRSQYDMAVDRFPCDGSPIRLPRMPPVSVDRVTWFNTDGTSQDFGSSGWFLDTYSEPGRLCLKSGYTWPSATRPQVGGVIRFTAGYTTTPESGIPDPLLEAVRKLALELYENREGVSIGNSVNEPLPYGIEEMIAEFVLPEVG
jgi:uncharacterized phiE125 gp8 family phage protein